MKIKFANFLTIFLPLLKRAIALMALAFLCLSCNYIHKKKSAPIVDNRKKTYSKNNPIKEKYSRLKSQFSNNNETAPSQQIEVVAGDTLYSISKKYQTPLRDLIEENNLSAPYSLKAGTKLIISKPNYYEVKKGDTLYSISRSQQMNIDNIVTLNNLQPPYKVTSGQKIKVRNSSPEIINEKHEITAETKQQKTQSPNNETAVAVSQNANKIEAKKISSPIIENKNNKFYWPLNGAVISKFGPKKGGLYNDGINIKAREGTAVKASEDGVVAYVGNELKGYGNLVIIKHSGGWITAYAHLSKATVKRGEKVHKAQMVGAVGSTGNVDAPQLYFGLRKGRDAVNPEHYLGRH